MFSIIVQYVLEICFGEWDHPGEKVSSLGAGRAIIPLKLPRRPGFYLTLLE